MLLRDISCVVQFFGAYSAPNNIWMYTGEGSGCETEYAWGTCMDLIPPYLSDSSTLAQVESINVVKFCYIFVSSSGFLVTTPSQIHI